MGYSTEFTGAFKFNKPVEENFKNYINTFSNTRRMRRDNDLIKQIFPDWKDYCFNGELGINGEYFAKDDDCFGMSRDDSIMTFNEPSPTQPSLWCDWIIEDDCLVWDDGEKFYNYVEWLEYLIKNFFEPEGYVLNGQIDFQGEDFDDCGTIIVTDNIVTVEYWD